MADQVAMVHKDLPETKETPVVVSRKSYERVWRSRGWRVAKTTKKGAAIVADGS